MDITADKYPKLYKAFELIANDANIEREKEGAFVIPDRHQQNAQDINDTLATLNDEDFETFCIGDQEKQEEIWHRSVGLREANAFLELFFGGRL